MTGTEHNSLPGAPVLTRTKQSKILNGKQFLQKGVNTRTPGDGNILPLFKAQTGLLLLPILSFKNIRKKTNKELKKKTLCLFKEVFFFS